PTLTVKLSAADAAQAAQTVRIDVDLNHNGKFDATEINFTTAALTGLSTAVKLKELPDGGTYLVRARVPDVAGNDGASATMRLNVALLDFRNEAAKEANDRGASGSTGSGGDPGSLASGGDPSSPGGGGNPGSPGGSDPGTAPPTQPMGREKG